MITLIWRTPPLTGRIGRVSFGGSNGPNLTGRRALERRRSVQVHGAIEIGPVLVYIVGPEEKSVEEFRFRANGEDLATRIDQLDPDSSGS